jgi:hypothetical protein
VVGDDRQQSTLFPELLDDYISEDNPVRAIDVFVDQLDLSVLGFEGVEPQATGRPSYHPATLLKLYVYGYAKRRSSDAVGAKQISDLMAALHVGSLARSMACERNAAKYYGSLQARAAQNRNRFLQI